MKLEEIRKEWDKDSVIDSSDLGRESLNIPRLHNKYYKIFMEEVKILKVKETTYDQLLKLKIEYYTGRSSDQDLKENSWEPFQLRLVKSDIPPYLDADKQLIQLKLDIAFQREKTNFAESILKTLNNRGFHIKNAIDWRKFTNGEN